MKKERSNQYVSGSSRCRSVILKKLFGEYHQLLGDRHAVPRFSVLLLGPGGVNRNPQLFLRLHQPLLCDGDVDWYIRDL